MMSDLLVVLSTSQVTLNDGYAVDWFDPSTRSVHSGVVPFALYRSESSTLVDKVEAWLRAFPLYTILVVLPAEDASARTPIERMIIAIKTSIVVKPRRASFTW
jgi:hypothetical protein